MFKKAEGSILNFDSPENISGIRSTSKWLMKNVMFHDRVSLFPNQCNSQWNTYPYVFVLKWHADGIFVENNIESISG